MKTKCYKLFLLSAIFCVAQTATIKSQTISPCGTDQHMQQMYAEHPELLQAQIDYDNMLTTLIKNNYQEKTTESVYYIPVVFHIIYANNYGEVENIPDANIYNVMDEINTDWAGLNADTALIVGNSPFDTLKANMKIQFRLARLDPDGNCTNGIEHIYSHLAYNADDGSKLNQWPRDRYLNIWVVHDFKPDPSGFQAAAYALFPSATTGFAYRADGVIALYNCVSSLAPSGPIYAKVLTHEIGHYFNLEHPWGNNNSAGQVCGDDGVDDTPKTKGHLACQDANKVPECTKDHTFSWVYGFNSVTAASGTTDMSASPNVNDDTVSVSHFSAVGVSANSIDTTRFGFTGWPGGAINGDTAYIQETGALDLSKYYEVTIAPKYSFALRMMSLSFNVKRNSTGVRSFAVRSSANNYLSNLSASISPANANLSIQGTNEFYIKSDNDTVPQNGCKITFPALTPYIFSIAPITYRFYGWNAEDTLGGSFSIDNVTFTDTAGVIENFDNHMDYSYCGPNGQRMFTKGQKARVRAAAESTVSYRDNLWRGHNDTITGTNSPYPVNPTFPCVPNPDFIANKRVICAGGSVTFTSEIWNVSLPLTASSTSVYKRWNFGDPSIAQSTAANPTVTFPNPGDYNVTLTDSITSGSKSITKAAMVRVMPTWAQYNGPTQENFENSSSYYWNWTIDNYDNNSNSWALANYTGYSGNHCMAMAGFHNYHDDVDDFITPGYDLYALQGGTITFRCAAATAATVSTDLNDVLQVYYSKDCGTNWFALGSLAGSALCNNGLSTTAFYPSLQSQWMLHSFNLPSNACAGNVRFKFKYTTGFASNNIYVDDININGTVGILENTVDDASVSIYPNPTNESSTIKYHLNVKGNVKIEMFDVIGKKIVEINNNNLGEGDYTTSISKSEHNLQNGIYFIRFSMDNKAITRKIIFTE